MIIPRNNYKHSMFIFISILLSILDDEDNGQILIYILFFSFDHIDHITNTFSSDYVDHIMNTMLCLHYPYHLDIVLKSNSI